MTQLIVDNKGNYYYTEHRKWSDIKNIYVWKNKKKEKHKVIKGTKTIFIRKYFHNMKEIL